MKQLMKQIELRFVFILVLVPVGIFYLVYQLDSQGFFNLETIQVEMANKVSDPFFFAPLAKELEKSIKSFQGQSLWKLPMKEVSNTLSQMNWIKTAKAVRKWPDSLRVEITPQDIFGLWCDDANPCYPVTETGQLLTAVDFTHAPDAVILFGKSFSDLSLRQKAVLFLKQLPKKGWYSTNEISELRLEPGSGFWVKLYQSDIEVRMGWEDLPAKAARVAKVLEYIKEHQIQARVIDANYAKKVLVRLRKDL